MAGIVAHLAVADKILKTLPTGAISDPIMFYAGNIAPDAIHARKDYAREMKKRTHLMSGISDRVFQEQKNVAEFNSRVGKFVTEFLQEDVDISLYLGYLSHILTDAHFKRTILADYTKAVAKIGIDWQDKRFGPKLIADMNKNDSLIAERYNFAVDFCTAFDGLPNYEISGFLTVDELQISRNWVVKTYFHERKPTEEPEYFTYNAALQFNDTAAADVVDKFTKMGVLL